MTAMEQSSAKSDIVQEASSDCTAKTSEDVPDVGVPRDWKFWCIILSLALCMLLTAIEFASVGNALPIIVQDLRGEQFIWVGSAYTLGATALLPLCAELAQVFGRRATVLFALLCFCVGSAICGAAPTMNALIVGRAIQGLGSGGTTVLIQIVLGDLVSLRERGTFNGVMAMAWAMGGGIGPVIGGGLAQNGQWRWLFYLNIPICGVTGILVAIFLRIRTPVTPLRERLNKIDWIGNFLITSSTISAVIGLVWGGVKYPWTSAHVLAPLICGFIGFCIFIAYEAWLSANPIVPMSLMADRTAWSGYAQTFFMGAILGCFCYWLPIYFQACIGASPIASGVDMFGFTYVISPVALIFGSVVRKTGRYRVEMWVAWVLIAVGCGLISSLDEHSSRSMAYGYQAITGVGIGIIYISVYFPVLAPIPSSQNVPAMGFLIFLRNFALTWGTTVGGAVLQNELMLKLPSDILAEFPHGTEIAFSVVPMISRLPHPLRDEVRKAFSGALQVVWRVLIGLAGVGLLVSFAMKALPLHTSRDEDWGGDEAKSLHSEDEKPHKVSV